MTHNFTFYSDNCSGAHPKVLKILEEVNHDYALPYGDEQYTSNAIKAFTNHFGTSNEIYFVTNGTAANVLSLKAMTKSYHAVLCTDEAHIYTAECGAVENFCRVKLIPLKSRNGKLTVELIDKHVSSKRTVHQHIPKVISITQPTELGTVYTIEEIKELATYAQKHDMLLHMDGARLANAAAYLGVSLKALTKDAGVDVLSFGGTKNGLLMGEAIVFFNVPLAKHFQYIQKQGLQLLSKHRFLSAQFSCYLANDLWLENAKQANAMAHLLAQHINEIKGYKTYMPVQSNIVLVETSDTNIMHLQKRYAFLIRTFANDKRCIRFVTSYLTKESDVLALLDYIKEAK